MKQKITQAALAELVGVDVTSISAVETGKYFPSADNLVKIVEILQIQFADLFEFDSLKTNEELFEDVVSIISSFRDDKKRLNSVRNFVKTLL